MISLSRYSSYFLLFLQYGEAIGVNFGVGLFGMFYPSQFMRQLYPKFNHSSAVEHAVSQTMTRMFCVTMILLGMIEYSLVRYCRSSSNNNDIRSIKESILRIFVSCIAIGDLIHICAFLTYHLEHGSSLELSSIGNIYGSILLFIARITYLWFNYQNTNKRRKQK